MRMRKKKNLIPRMERCAAQLIRDPYDRRGHWRELMPQARELRLELGCGKGRFTLGTAQAEPDVLFIAVELVPDAMVVAMERCVNAGLTNVFFVDANADQLPQFFAPGEVDRIYLNFSDPWPSNRHAKRRLTHGNFLTVLSTLFAHPAQCILSTRKFFFTILLSIFRRVSPQPSPKEKAGERPHSIYKTSKYGYLFNYFLSAFLSSFFVSFTNSAS